MISSLLKKKERKETTSSRESSREKERGEDIRGQGGAQKNGSYLYSYSKLGVAERSERLLLRVATISGGLIDKEG